MKLLLVEDDRKVGHLLTSVLAAHGYDVTLAATAREALGHRSELDLAVIDWMLPDGDGVEVCTSLRRADFEGPVLFLTARGEIKDRIHALDFGADDYLVKPFDIDELLARLRALTRRGPRIACLDVGPLHIDLMRRYAFVHKRLLDLAPREFDLLTYVARRAGKVVAKDELVTNVWQA
ncbi:MAG TPA: response regulator transcription factor, partial [Polyangiaceae bacterium]